MSYSCHVKNCGDGQCVHHLVDEVCPVCGNKIVIVLDRKTREPTGVAFCSQHEFICSWERYDWKPPENLQ